MKGKLRLLRRIDGEPAEMSDEALMAACGKGDSAALGALFDRHHQAVYRFISRTVGRGAWDLDDLVQSTFLEVHRSAHRFRGDAAVKSWIFGIAVNVARHHIRGEVRRRHLKDAVAALPSQPQESPLRIVQRQVKLSRLAAGIRALPEHLRVAFVMCDLEGISGVDTARVLGIRQGTLWRRLHDARKTLCAIIESGESDDG